jgi:ribonuclease BN (tRNA processing enzyme)
MDINVLGCSGGVGSGLRTTALLIDDDILIDAGSGVGELTLVQMSRIKHIFLTHSHLDHICCIPLLLDSIFDTIEEPIQLHASKQTLNALQKHIFNHVIWPDFTSLPTQHEPVLSFQTMNVGEQLKLGERTITMIEVNHSVPAVAYHIEKLGKAFAFSGDTTTNNTLWNALNALQRLDLLIVEAAFPNEELQLSFKARHYCPKLLAEDLKKLNHQPEIYISHNKPGTERLIFEQCKAAIKDRNVHRLVGGSSFTL